MTIFEDIQDVEEWLEPFEINAFWDAVAPWDVFAGEERAHYEQVLAKGDVCPDLVLSCLKGMVRMELQARLDLKDRYYEPPDAQYLRRTH